MVGETELREIAAELANLSARLRYLAEKLQKAARDKSVHRPPRPPRDKG